MLVAGVDEVGRGPLAGPVVACAVILDERYPIEGLKDSKELTEKKREQLCIEIKQHALCYAIGFATVKEIDDINILQASLLAMKRAVENLLIVPDMVKVDGNKCPSLKMKMEAIIGGDKLIPEISAGSIIAKVARDKLMNYFDIHYPQYGFGEHKGYSTKAHLAALKKYGVSTIHRQSFAPVKNQLEIDLA